MWKIAKIKTKEPREFRKIAELTESSDFYQWFMNGVIYGTAFSFIFEYILNGTGYSLLNLVLLLIIHITKKIITRKVRYIEVEE